MTSKAKGGGAGKVKALKDALGGSGHANVTEQEIRDCLSKHLNDENAAFMELQKSKEQWEQKPKRDKPKKADTRTAVPDQAAPAPGGRGGAGRGRGGPGGRGAGRGGGRDTQGFEGGRRGRRDGPPSGPPRDGPPRQRREEPPAPAATAQPAAVKTTQGGTVTSYARVRDTPVGTTGKSFADMLAPKQAVSQPAQQPEPTPTFAETQVHNAWASHAQAQAKEAASTDPVVEPPEQPAAPEPVSDGWGAAPDSTVPDKEDAPEPIAPVQTEPEEVPAAADPVVQEVQSAPVPASVAHQPSPYRPPQATHHDIAPAPALESRQAHRHYRPRAQGPDVVLPDQVAQWGGGGDVSFGFAPTAAPDLSEGLADSNGARATPPSGTPNMPPQMPVANNSSLLPENVSSLPPQNPGNSIPAANSSAQSRAQPQSMPPSQPTQGHHASHMQPHHAMPPHQSQQAGPPRQQQHGQQPGQGRAQHGHQQGFPSSVGQSQSMQGMMQGYNFDNYDASSMQFPSPSTNGTQMPGGENFYNNAGGSVQGNMGPGFQYPNPQQANRQGGKNFPNHDPMGKQGMNPSPHPHVPNMPGGQQSGMASQYPYQMAPPYYHMGPQMMPGQFPGMPYQGQVRSQYGAYGGYPQDYAGMPYMGGAGYGAGYGGADEKMGQFYGASSGQDPASPGGKGFSGASGSGNTSAAAKSQPMSSSPAKEMSSNFGGFGGYPGGPHFQPTAYASGN